MTVVGGPNELLIKYRMLELETVGLRNMNRRLTEMLRRVAMDYGEQCDDPWNCDCSMGVAVRFTLVGLKEDG